MFTGDVVLDDFDKFVDEQSGKASSVMEDIYGDRVSERTAESKLSGVRQHIAQKKKLLSVTGEFQYKKEKLKFAEDGSKTIEKIISLSDSEMNDPSIIMQKMGLDPIQWELMTCELDRKAYQVTMRMSQGVDEDGNKNPDKPETITNHAFDCKVRVKPIQDKIDSELIRKVFADLKPPVIEQIKYTVTDGCMLELPLNDFHLGNRAEHSDLETQTALYKRTVLDILASIEQYRIRLDLIVFQIGQDFFHVDGSAETTTSGTKLETTTSWSEIYRRGIEVLIWTIEQLRHIAPIQIYYVPGNHDKTLSFAAALNLETFYHDVDGVIVDTVDYPRKYVQYGTNLVGMSHGRGEGKRIETLMQTEAPEMWGATTIREFHLGDIHHETVKEAGGITFRRISALTEVNEWHIEKGYTSATRKAQAFVWDKKKGKILTIDSYAVA